MDADHYWPDIGDLATLLSWTGKPACWVTVLARRPGQYLVYPWNGSGPREAIWVSNLKLARPKDDDFGGHDTYSRSYYTSG